MVSEAPYVSAGKLGGARKHLSSVTSSAMSRSWGCHQLFEWMEPYSSSLNITVSNFASQSTATPLSSTRTFPWGNMFSKRSQVGGEVVYSVHAAMDDIAVVEIGQASQDVFGLAPVRG
jgi:hypothetical protein